MQLPEDATKKCSKCGQVKSTSNFYRDKRASDGLHSGCKECHYKVVKRYAQANPEVARANSSRYRAKNRTLVKAKEKVWRAENREKLRQYQSEYAKRHPEKIRELVMRSTAKRKARKLNALPVWADLAAINEIYRECRRLNRQSEILYHVDHIVPLISATVCGLHVPANLQIIPASDNVRKRNEYWPDMP